MSLISRARRQDAVWWPMLGRDKYAAVTYGTPCVIRVRWDSEDAEVRAADGSTVVCHAAVMVSNSLKVNEGMAIGDLLWLGNLDEYTGSITNPKADGALDIKAFSITPNLKNSETLLIARL